MRLGVVESMDCSHFLPGHRRCGLMHGHTYRVEVQIEGEARGGMILDFADLKGTLREVLALYDHRSLNDFLEYPSVENLCGLLKRDLGARLPFPLTVRVWEGDGKWAEL
jgi:6-pyruvoyltetrahydropterin/6-carboxytetrahydropterin synthase